MNIENYEYYREAYGKDLKWMYENVRRNRRFNKLSIIGQIGASVLTGTNAVMLAKTSLGNLLGGNKVLGAVQLVGVVGLSCLVIRSANDIRMVKLQDDELKEWMEKIGKEVDIVEE